MHDFVNESFNRTNSYEYKLSIQVSLSGFSFCIQQIPDGQLLAFKQSDFIISGEHLLARRFHDWYREEELLQLAFSKKEIVINNRNFSLVPEACESENLKKAVNELLPGGRDSDYAEGWIKSIKAKLIYKLPAEFTTTINQTLGETRLIHPVQKLIGYQKRSEIRNLLLIYCDEKDMYVVFKKEDELALCNSFRINHANDAVYFVLTILKQFGMTAKDLNVQTCGKALYLTELDSMLAKYVKRVDLLLPLNLPSAALPLNDQILNENLCLF